MHKLKNTGYINKVYHFQHQQNMVSKVQEVQDMLGQVQQQVMYMAYI